MTKRRTNPNFMNGVPELLVLMLLTDREMYGYEVVQAVRSRTADAIVLGEGVIYPVLHALERDGALKSRRHAVNGRSRIYYSVTAKGKRRRNDLTSTWVKLTSAVQDIIAGGKHVEAI